MQLELELERIETPGHRQIGVAAAKKTTKTPSYLAKDVPGKRNIKHRRGKVNAQ